MEESILFIYLMQLIMNLLSSALSIAAYVLGSLGMHTIAKRRGIEKPWLAWIPVANAWTLGCISDQYRYVVKGENKSKRKILLGLHIAIIAVMIVFFIIMGVMFVDIFSMALGSVSEEEIAMSLLGSMGGMMLAMIPMFICSIVYSVFYYMALYDLYNSCDPKNNVLFLVLSIVLGIQSFFIFAVRNKDLGMPPRKQEPVQPLPPQSGWQPPQQPQQPQYYWQPPQENTNNKI